MPDRVATEAEIIALIQSAASAGVDVGALPQGEDWEQMFRFRAAAVWVAYAGATTRENQAAGSALVQAETWTWSVLVLARNYRSPQAANTDALTLLGTVISALAGQTVTAGKMVKVRDGLIAFPKQAGIVAYEAVFSVQTYLRSV